MTQQQTQAAFHMLHAPYRARMPGLPRAENAAIPLSRLLAIVILTAWSSPFAAAQSAANSGCGNPPYTSCTDPVPATFISGSWIETDSASEWTLTANNASPGVAGTVTGTVLVFPIAPLCPVINYTIAAPGPSFYTPSSIVTGTEGTTTFTWVAINPNPSGSCGGSTPVTSQTFRGTIANKGNDITTTGTYTNSGGSGPIALETNLILTPTGETLSLDTQFDPNGFGPPLTPFVTQLNFIQELNDTKSYDPADPNNNKFQGRQVFETANGSPSDTCYEKALALGQTYPGGSFKINGAVWNVGWNGSGNGNKHGDDSIGWTTVGVNWYRTKLPESAFPCTATIPQAMTIVGNVPGVGNTQYATHNLSVTLTLDIVTITKDSISKVSNY